MRSKLLAITNKLESLALDLSEEVDEAEIDQVLRRAASGKPHSNGRSLYDHLQGTREILRSWGEPLWVQLGGLFHSIYSTEFYTRQCLALSDRSGLQKLIGGKAERLAYLFGACSREQLQELIGSTEPGAPRRLALKDRFTGHEEPIRTADLCALAMVVIANQADQSCAEDGSPGPWLSYVSDLGYHLRSHSERVPAIMDRCRMRISRADERRLIDNYRNALLAISNESANAEQFLEECEKDFPFLGETRVWLAYLAVQRGQLVTASEHARIAADRFNVWATPWDKRLSLAEWRKICQDISCRDEASLEPLKRLLPTHSPSEAVAPSDLARIEKYLTKFAHRNGSKLLVYPLSPVLHGMSRMIFRLQPH